MAGCDRTDPITAGAPGPVVAYARAAAGAVREVTNVDELYAAVNDPANASAAILLAPGTYLLTPADAAGVPRPNGGRLELQEDMSLRGRSGDRSAVTIDGTALPVASLTMPAPVGRTAPIRVGRGHNALEWLTIRVSADAAAGIETDLGNGAPASVRIANVVATGGQRGLDARNVGAAMAGRRLELDVTASEFAAAMNISPSQAIRVVNANGANGAAIVARLAGNVSRDSQFGCLVGNLASSNAVIEVRSSGDRFTGNGLGCFVDGGIVTGLTGAAHANTTTFEAHGSAFVDNTQPAALGRGGILAIGGEAPVLSGATSGNTVVIRLWGTTVARNEPLDFEAYGARSASSGGLAGVGNRVLIELNGISKRVQVDATASVPDDPNGTNTVRVVP